MNLANFFKHDFNDGIFELYDKNGKLIFWENSRGDTWGIPKSQEVEMTVKELQDLISKQKGINVKLKIKE